MKVLVINAGSSSLKYQLIETCTECVLSKGIVERIGQKVSAIKHSGKAEFKREDLNAPTHTEAVKAVLDALLNPEYGVIKSVGEISAVGHRVVHGGEDFSGSVLIDGDVLSLIQKNSDLAPLHNPANIIGIKACKEIMASAPQAAVFDTSFHSTLPPYAYMYAIPYGDYKKYRLRRYGFHGTSHLFVSGEVEKIYGKMVNTIVCHLGNGASVSAVKDGRCIDTSMGLTPLEGLIMGTRSGDIDAAAIDYLCDKTGMNVKEVTDYLNKKSGVFGVSGVSSDFRDLNASAASGNERAALAISMFAYRVKKYIGSYAAALGGVECIAFTGGVGEYNPNVRKSALEGLEFMGVSLDDNLNENAARGETVKISNGATGVYVIPTNEELVIARETLGLVTRR
jgi:acetate kinase